MKNPVSWHKECLANARAHYERLREQIESMTQDYARAQQELNAYDAQIIRAEAMGLVEFDREKFGKKRGSAAHGGESSG